MNDGAVYVTAEGLEEMKAEYQERVDVRRVIIAERLDDAIKMGDLKENADYHAAKEDQAFNEGRIKQLQSAIRSAVVIAETKDNSRVRLGSTVTIAEDGFEDEEEVYKSSAHAKQTRQKDAFPTIPPSVAPSSAQPSGKPSPLPPPAAPSRSGFWQLHRGSHLS